MKKSYIAIAAIAVVAVVIAAAVLLTGALDSPESKTIRYTDVPPVNQQAFIQQGQIDGGVSWEPFCSDSITNGTAKALLWSGEIWPEHPCCVVAVDGPFLASNPDAVKAMLKAHMEASQWITDTVANKSTPDGQANYTLLLNIGSTFSNRNTTVVESALEHIVLDYKIQSAQIDYFKTFTEEYLKNGLIKNETIPDVDAFVNGFVDTSYLAAAESVQPVAMGAPLTTVRVGYLQGDLHQYARVVAENAEVGALLGLGDRSVFEAYGIDTVNPSAMPGSGYPNGGAVMTGFANKDMDVGYLGAPPALLNHANQNIDVKIVALANKEGSALVVKNSVGSINDLDGLLIGEPGVSSIQYLLLLKIADQYGYTVVKA
jgi:NitT/TauT family transport system substrate-binding protein